MSSIEAIIHEGGRQFTVQAGSVIAIDRQGLKPGDRVELTDVRLLITPQGVQVGKPRVAGAKVVGKVQANIKGEKLDIYKYRRRKNSAQRRGHRQRYARVRIMQVEAK